MPAHIDNNGKGARANAYIASPSYHSYDGHGSLAGEFTPGAFRAKWLTWLIKDREDFQSMPRAMRSVCNPFPERNIVWKRADELLFGNESSYRSVMFIEALAEDGKTVYKAADSQEEGAKVEKGVLCASVDGVAWEWKGVYEAPVREFKMDRRYVCMPLGVGKAEPEPSEDGDSGWEIREVLLV